MAIADFSQLRDWLADHCAPREPSRYARIRAGRARKNADQVWRQTLTGASADEVARAVLDRHARLGKGEKGWLEVMEVGGKGTIDVLPLGEAEVDPDDGEDGDGDDLMEQIKAAGPVAAVVAVVVETNKHLRDENRHLRELLHDVSNRHTESTAQAVAASVLLEWQEKHGGVDKDGMQAALEQLAPSLGPALSTVANAWAAKMVGTPPAAPSGDPNATTDQRLLTAIAELDALLTADPGVYQRHAMELPAIGPRIQQAAMGAMGG